MVCLKDDESAADRICRVSKSVFISDSSVKVSGSEDG